MPDVRHCEGLHVMELEYITDLEIRGVKRGNTYEDRERARIKKARRSVVDTENPGSSSTSEGGLSDEELVSSPTASTPQSLGISRQSPQIPSNLKTQPCPYPDCPKLFNRRARLNAHIRSHTNTRPFVCPHSPCTKDFLRNEHLQRHIKSAHTEVRDYVCPREGCGKGYSTGTRLRRHVAAHEAREPYTCNATGCKQAFRKHVTLQAHITSVHEGKIPYICTEIKEDGRSCTARFETAAKLKNHKNRVHSAARYRCTLCSGGETRQSRVQEDDVTQPPPGLPFSSYGAFLAHKKAVHPLICASCGYQTAYPGDLNRHVEIHHGGQDFVERLTHHCKESGCGRSFTRRGNLLIHMKTVHAHGRAYVCGTIDLNRLNNIANWLGKDPCGKGFTSKASLEKHIRIAHMGLGNAKDGKVKGTQQGKGKATALARLTGTAYDKRQLTACLRLDCDQRFSREYDLEMHLQSAHGMADFEIQYLRAEHNHIGTYAESLTNGQDVEIRRTLHDQLASTSLDRDTRMASQGQTEEALEVAARHGGQFWIAGAGLEDMEQDHWDINSREIRGLIEENDWEANVREMRRLIDDNDALDEEDDEIAIDPNLG